MYPIIVRMGQVSNTTIYNKLKMSSTYPPYQNSPNNNPNPYNQPSSQPNMWNQIQQSRTNNADDYNRNMQIINNDNYGYNKDEQDLGGNLYENSRSGFIRKVYTLLSLQLIITALICVWAMKSDSFKNVFMNNAAIIIVSVLLMALSIFIGCFSETLQKYGLPIMIAFTLLFAILVGIICAKTKPEIVLTATAITAAIVVALTIFACVTKTDLTGMGPYLFIFLMVMLIFGIVCIFWRNPIVHLVYACLAALLYGLYLIFDTQLVLGKFENKYSLDDAYFAAIQLYIDIIEIFLQVLQILSYANN